MINCCSTSGSELCFRVPESYSASERLPLTISPLLPPSPVPQGSCSYPPATRSELFCRNNLLHAAPIKHDPYTPDSMDSPSPNAIAAASDSMPLDLDVQSFINVGEQSDNLVDKCAQPFKYIDRAVSPSLLKSRLELIAERRRWKKPSQSESGSDSNLNSDHDEDHDNDPNTEKCTGAVRKNRSNSDVSWQRSQLLTRAWLQGKSQQVYHSFSNNLHYINDKDIQGEKAITGKTGHLDREYLFSADMVIPKIAIINASNFESNASSVHLYEDSVSRKIITVDTGQPSDQYLDTLYANTRTRSLSETDSSQDKYAMAFTTEEDQSKQTFKEVEEEEIEEEEEEIKLELAEDSMSIVPIPLILDNEKQLRNNDISAQIDEIGKIILIDPIIIADNTRQEIMSSASKDTTRSNSIQSQEVNVSLKLKAYNKVTERCKRNIVEKKSRCEKCCIIL